MLLLIDFCSFCEDYTYIVHLRCLFSLDSICAAFLLLFFFTFNFFFPTLAKNIFTQIALDCSLRMKKKTTNIYLNKRSRVVVETANHTAHTARVKSHILETKFSSFLRVKTQTRIHSNAYDSNVVEKIAFCVFFLLKCNFPVNKFSEILFFLF